jgi:hypothetical protein
VNHAPASRTRKRANGVEAKPLHRHQQEPAHRLAPGTGVGKPPQDERGSAVDHQEVGGGERHIDGAALEPQDPRRARCVDGGDADAGNFPLGDCAECVTNPAARPSENPHDEQRRGGRGRRGPRLFDEVPRRVRLRRLIERAPQPRHRLRRDAIERLAGEIVDVGGGEHQDAAGSDGDHRGALKYLRLDRCRRALCDQFVQQPRRAERAFRRPPSDDARPQADDLAVEEGERVALVGPFGDERRRRPRGRRRTVLAGGSADRGERDRCGERRGSAARDRHAAGRVWIARHTRLSSVPPRTAVA